MQAGLLARVCGAVKPGGRLVYSVCTLTRTETTAVADAFEAAHPEFEPVALALAAGAAPGAVPEAADPTRGGSRLWLRPEDLEANGMFVAAWRRKP